MRSSPPSGASTASSRARRSAPATPPAARRRSTCASRPSGSTSALAALSKLGHVTERSQSLQDITGSFASAQERLTDARAERRGLLRALGRATTQNQIASIKAQLRSVGGRISGLKGQLASLRRRADLSTVDLTVRGGGRASRARGGGGQWTPGDAAGDALRVLEVVAGVALICLAVLAPLGLIGAAIALGRAQRPAAAARDGARSGLTTAAARAGSAPREPPRQPVAPASCAIAHTMQTREQEAIELLTHVPVFETLGPKELAQVAAVTVPRTFDAGHVIFREGDESDTCYIVRNGHARAIREHGDGRTLTLAHFGPGDIFGELAMFDDERRSATVETLDDVEAIAVLGADMRRLLREHPGLAVKLVISLGRRLREANERIARQSFQTVQSRVAGVLGQLVAQAQAEGGGDRDVLVTITQADIAQLAGSSRESASRFLAVLERAGVVTQGRGRVTVHDPAALERYVY